MVTCISDNQGHRRKRDTKLQPPCRDEPSGEKHAAKRLRGTLQAANMNHTDLEQENAFIIRGAAANLT